MASQLLLAQKPYIQLQIEALVEESRIDPLKISNYFDKLKEKILAIRDSIGKYEKILNYTIKLPLVGRPNSFDSDYPKAFKFLAPEDIRLVGSITTSTAIKAKTFVDIVITIPSKCFEKKDAKNQRYHRKRALYLAKLASILASGAGGGLIDKMEFRYHQGDVLRPVLVVIPRDNKIKKIAHFQIFAHIDGNDCPFRQTIFNPGHGNIAPKWFFKNYQHDSLIEGQVTDIKSFMDLDSESVCTPFYNSTILNDMELISNSDVISEQIGSRGSIGESIILIKIWLVHLGLDKQFSFIMSMFVASLQTRQVIHQNMSSFQIFKQIIKSFLSLSDWSGTGLSYYDDSNDKLPEFKKHFPVVFLSPSARLNLCYNITLDLYQRLCHEATIADRLLSNPSQDTFEILLLKKRDFYNKFDAILHIPKCTRKMPLSVDLLTKFMDHGMFTQNIYSGQVMSLIRRALSDRVVLIQQGPQHLGINDKRWNIKAIPFDPNNQDPTFTVGLLLHGENSLRIIDIGPAANSPEAEDFRKFWEPKSQLRLQDGTISETVVWHVDSFSHRRSIIKFILTHALKKLDINQLTLHYTVLERSVTLRNVFFDWDNNSSRVSKHLKQADTNGTTKQNPNKRKRELSTNESNDTELKIQPIGTGEDLFHKVLASYNEFNKVLRSLENMKYLIVAIQPTSSHVRSTSIFPPMPVSLQPKNKNLKRRKGVTFFPEKFAEAGRVLHIEPIEVLITLESSAKWPSDMQALEAAKQAYLIQMSEVLRSQSYSTKLCDDGNNLDVMHGQFIFRLRVKCQKEMILAGSPQRKFDLEIIPRVHAALDQVFREKIAYSMTCRIVKRWLSCQLLTDHLSDLTIELLVASLFIAPEPYTEPASSACGFRRFLELIANHNWKQSPLVINFDDKIKIDEVKQIRDSMAEDRSKYPPMVICTPYDKEISAWTRSDPCQESLELIVRICTKAHEYFNSEVILKHDMKDEYKALFRPNFKVFNLLIKLNTKVVQNFYMSFDAPREFSLRGRQIKTKNPSAFAVMPIVGLNLVEQYTNLLRNNLGHLAWFFYDKYGQRLIGVVLKPESEKQLDGDLTKLISDIKKLGSDMVHSINIIKSDKDIKEDE